MTLGQNTSLNGFVPFPATDPWRQDVSAAPLDPNSSTIIANIGTATRVHPDFGAGLYNGSTVGIPYSIVSKTPFVNITNNNGYPDDSDRGPMPIPTDALVESYPNVDPNGDQHVLILDRDNCWLYELYYAQMQSDGSWNAASSVTWDLLNNEQRPYTLGSADAAGLPIFPGLARYDEVAAGAINHALRFTLIHSRQAFVPPATHYAGYSYIYNAPMGMRMRLKASFDISSYSPQAKVILTALKKYGMIMADNGGSMFITGAPNDNWNNADLQTLSTVTASNFEVIQETPLYTPSTIPAGPAPVISSFTAVLKRGTRSTYTLAWTGTNASYYLVTPEVGAVRGNAAFVTPNGPTTYTLYATNQYGRTTATITINAKISR